MPHEFLWIGFAIIVVVIMILDLGIFQKGGHIMSMKEAVVKTILFVLMALGFNSMVWIRDGSTAGMEFLAGYLIELSLSVDNLFVFLMLFSFFKVQREYQNRVLFWGILGALILRGIFVFAGAALINEFHWIMYIFGAFLIFTAAKMFFQKEKDLDPEKSLLIRLLRKTIPISKDFHGNKFFVKKGSKHFATPLFIVLVLVEITDIMFAFDSIPAIFAVTKDPFIVFTSNVFAILGLRALYFCIAGLMDSFVYLKPALSFILAFVGIKMLIVDFYKIPTVASLLFIVLALVIAIVASLIKAKKEKAA